MPDTTAPTATSTAVVAAEGVSADLDLTGAGLAAFAAAGSWITGPGAVTVLAAERGRVVPLVGPEDRWRVLDDSVPATVTLVADTDRGITPTVTATVGGFGLAVIHGVTNTSDRPVRVGLAVRLHPDGGPDARCSLCGDGPPAHLDVVGADTTVVPGRAVSDGSLTLEVGGGRPLPGKTHVVHRLRAPGGDERLRIWGDVDYTDTRAVMGDGDLALELRTVPATPAVADLREIAPGETWMLSWGLQPDGFAGPQAPGSPA